MTFYEIREQYLCPKLKELCGQIKTENESLMAVLLLL